MKKIVLVLVMLVLVSGLSYADEIDESYVELIFNSLDAFGEDRREEMGALLADLIVTDVGLDALYLQAIKQESAMEKYGVTADDIKRNVDALKTWSQEDRLALVEAGIRRDANAISELNLKQSVTEKKVVCPIRKALITKEISIKPYLEDKKFENVSNHWSKEYVEYLVVRGVISGKSEKEFAPEASITKAETVTLVTKLLIQDMSHVPEYTGSAADITSGKWYDAHMQRGITLGFIDEDETHTLEPMRNSTREEVIEIIIKSLDALEIEIDDELKIYNGTFVDYDSISLSRKEAMNIAINLGFISGKGNGVLDPKSEIKRSEIAVIIKKLYLYVVEYL